MAGPSLGSCHILCCIPHPLMHSHIKREKKVVVKSRFPLHGTPPPATSGGYLYTMAHSSFYCSKAVRWRPPPVGAIRDLSPQWPSLCHFVHRSTLSKIATIGACPWHHSRSIPLGCPSSLFVVRLTLIPTADPGRFGIQELSSTCVVLDPLPARHGCSLLTKGVGDPTSAP